MLKLFYKSLLVSVLSGSLLLLSFQFDGLIFSFGYNSAQAIVTTDTTTAITQDQVNKPTDEADLVTKEQAEKTLPVTSTADSTTPVAPAATSSTTQAAKTVPETTAPEVTALEAAAPEAAAPEAALRRRASDCSRPRRLRCSTATGLRSAAPVPAGAPPPPRSLGR